MIVLHKDDDKPEGAIITVIRGDEAIYYFHDDKEADEILNSRNEAIINKQRIDQKQERTHKVQAIKVTTANGNIFDGDEISQQRMARSILIMDDTETVNWVLSDNRVIQATKSELIEALRLAGKAQASMWVIE